MINVTRIILVDDHKIVRQGFRKLLEEVEGFTIVGEALNGSEALKLVSELKPDILITDLRMHGMGGIELTRKVKQSFPETEVIILSMYGAEAYVYSALCVGAKAYVVKQSSLKNLSKAIYAVLRGEKYLSPPLTRDSIDTYVVNNNKSPIPW